MKPLMLKIAGLNSFIEEQSIDFSALVRRGQQGGQGGLFGIFGPTGSGKSTVLDAITIALYDKIARNSKEFINKEAEAAAVSFLFSIQEGREERKYLAERRYKRAKDGGYRAAFARLTEQHPDGTAEVLEDTGGGVTRRVAEMTGLCYDDFVRSVVLPQGKFSEFLSLTGKDRRVMLERIFHLEKYGKNLTEKIRAQLQAEESSLKQTESKLSVYGELSSDSLLLEKEALSALEEEAQAVSAQLEEHKEPLLEKREVFRLMRAKEDAAQKEALLLEKQEQMEETRAMLLRAEAASVLSGTDEERKKAKEKFSRVAAEKDSLFEKKEGLSKKALLAEKEYQAAAEAKASEYPRLLRRAETLKQAVVLAGELAEAEQERLALLERYKTMRKEAARDKQAYNQILEDQSKAEAEQAQLLEEMQEAAVDSVYREKVNQACTLEAKKQELMERASSLSKKQAALNVAVLEREKAALALLEQKKEADKELEKQKETRDTLAEKEQTLRLSAVEREQRIKGLLDAVQLLEDAALALFKAEQEQTACEERLTTIKKEYAEAETERKACAEALLAVEEQVKAFEKAHVAALLAETLLEGAPCPVCGAADHPNPAKAISEHMQEGLLEKQKNCAAALEKAAAKAEKQRLDLEKCQMELSWQTEQTALCKEKAAEGPDTKKCALEQEKQAKEVEQAALLETEMRRMEAVTALAEAERQAVALTEACAKAEEGEKNIKHQVSETEQELSGVQEELAKAEADFLAMAEELPEVESFVQEKERILSLDRKRAGLTERETKSRSRLKALMKERDRLLLCVREQEKELAAIEASGKERKQAALLRQEKLTAMALSGRKPEALLVECQSTLEQILSEEKRLAAVQGEAAKALQEASVCLAKAESEWQTLSAACKEKEEQFASALFARGFADEADYLKSLLPATELAKKRDAISAYDEALLESRANHKRLLLELGGRAVSAEALTALEKEVQELTQRKELLGEHVAVKRQAVSDLEKNLAAVLELRQTAKEQEHRRSVLYELYNLLKGNRLIDFMANKELQYITREASERLMHMTRGRYALTISDGEFMVADNFDGGRIRKPNTLSGGETFLTSLSLALALSSKIQMKNRAPLKFFFLDEGFGTLDAALLETVMNALSELQKEQLAVGVISHVEEMKERIPVKLLVTPAVFGVCGTRVKLSDEG